VKQLPLIFIVSLLMLPITTLLATASSEMALVPSGEFLMGSPAGAEAFDDEQPQRQVYVGAFWMDRQETTHAEYELFVRATGHRVPANANPGASLWDTNAPLPGSADHPVINVSWEDATAYCAWRGKRLPTEAEWEKAARGTDARRYPWGNNWDHARANSASFWAGRTIQFDSGEDWNAFWVKGEGARISRERGLKGEVLTVPVGSFPNGASPYGMLDMAGNVSEWVQDWYDPGYYAKSPLADPQGPTRGAIKAMRGGSWLKPARSLRTTDRDYGNVASRPSGAGIRCARDER
jgi:formylglycine-generating enzyme required for sulfatase activity